MVNDYYVEIIGNKEYRYLDDMYTLPMCEECEGKGIFYFTGEESLYHSQVCGECHGKGWMGND